MDVLRATYGGESSDEDIDKDDSPRSVVAAQVAETKSLLPPPPLSLLDLPNFKSGLDDLPIGQSSRVRSFPHVEGNYALHVYIPVYIPTTIRKEVALFFKKVSSLVAALHLVDLDVPLSYLCKNDHQLELIFGRQFHISLGRTVPIRVHQIDSIVSMLCQKLQFQRHWSSYWIDFSKWETFVNDDLSRTFLSMEITAGGLMEIRKQIQAVNEVYRLHNLPEFYKDARPHISLGWALGDISKILNGVLQQEIKSSTAKRPSERSIFTTKFSGIECKIGQKTYQICKCPDE